MQNLLLPRPTERAMSRMSSWNLGMRKGNGKGEDREKGGMEMAMEKGEGGKGMERDVRERCPHVVRPALLTGLHSTLQ